MTSAGSPDPQGLGIGVWQAAIAFGMFLLGVLSSIVGATWTLGKSREKLVEKIDATRLELDRRIDAESDVVAQRVGETFTALRQKITDMELWNRDNFVSKNTFTFVMGDIKDWQRRFEEKIDRRFDKLEDKLSPPEGGIK